jgi:hypothetical protein
VAYRASLIAALTMVALILPPPAFGREAPKAGSERVVWMRKHLVGTVSKFGFTAGYPLKTGQPETIAAFFSRLKAAGMTAWDTSLAEETDDPVWNDVRYELLTRDVKAAEQAGLDVWVTLLPPSESSAAAAMHLETRRDYYLRVVGHIAGIAAEHPNLVAYTIDDFTRNLHFFTADLVRDFSSRTRSIAPDLAFVPLVYYSDLSPKFFAELGPYVDGIVFQFRAESVSNRPPKGDREQDFAAYGQVMKAELEHVRELAGERPVICGIYVGYYHRGRGVAPLDREPVSEKHMIEDAVLKARVARDQAGGLRIYGLGIDHPVYKAMGRVLRGWKPSAGATSGPGEAIR